MVLGIYFQVFSNTNFYSDIEKLTWRFYTTAKALFNTSKIKIINKKEFIKATLGKNSKIFVIHVATLKILTTILIHPFQAPYIYINLILAAL